MKFILLFTLVAATHAVSLISLEVDEWNSFKLQHGKSYSSDVEEKFRMKIFFENKNKISKHNSLYDQGVHSYRLGMNKYGDLLHHEFVNTMNGYKRDYNTSRSYGATFISPAHVELAKSVDWREKGAVTPVKDQGQCGSCWSFSSTGALEGQHFRKIGTLISLSEQNLIDCSFKYGNEGCNGGLMDKAFQYVKDNGGIDTEKSYPYEGEDDKCRFNRQDIGATDKGFVDVEAGNEKKLKEAVATVGPISVAIDASHESFQFYREGIYMEKKCSPEQLDHGVLVVGYGTDHSGINSHGQAYWIVKNSWGESWGENGYIKMARNYDNMCGIASSASYPLV